MYRCCDCNIPFRVLRLKSFSKVLYLYDIPKSQDDLQFQNRHQVSRHVCNRYAHLFDYLYSKFSRHYRHIHRLHLFQSLCRNAVVLCRKISDPVCNSSRVLWNRLFRHNSFDSTVHRCDNTHHLGKRHHHIRCKFRIDCRSNLGNTRRFSNRHAIYFCRNGCTPSLVD